MSNGPGVVASWFLARTQRAWLAVFGLAGAAAGLGQAPFGLTLVSLVGLSLLFIGCGLTAAPRLLAWRVWVAATVYFALCLHWIVEPFFVEAEVHGWMAPFALVLLSGGLGLFWAAPAWIAARATDETHSATRILLFSSLLLLFEAARGRILTGFPWAQPGHVLIDTPLLLWAQWFGAHGLTFLILAQASIIAILLLRYGGFAVLAVLAPTLVVVAMADSPPAPEFPENRPTVRLVQPNAPQHLKWLPDMIPVFFERGLELTAAQAEGQAPALIIWPETSLPELLGRSETSRAAIAAAGGSAYVLVGAQRFEGIRVRNAAALIAPDGAIDAIYDKHHLVPFGEYIPFGRLADALGLRGMAEVLAGGYAPGPGPALMDLGPLGQAFPMICYEAIFPHYIHQVNRPDFMIHVTNDAWFGEFSGPYQHLELARLRAAEQGLPVLRAANTGVSAVIDAYGQVVSSLPLGEAGFLDEQIPAARPPTLFSRVGSTPLLGIMTLFALGLIVFARRQSRHSGVAT